MNEQAERKNIFYCNRSICEKNIFPKGSNKPKAETLNRLIPQSLWKRKFFFVNAEDMLFDHILHCKVSKNT